jgi:hypothetical protein
MSLELRSAQPARSDSPAAARPRRNTDRRTKGDGSVAISIFSALVTGALVWAWTQRETGLIDPKVGFGYYIGIGGAVLMLMLILYPMRKRLRAMRTWGNPAEWFRWHMVLGILGPMLIIIHSNFRLASANASVALAAMLIVAGSGIAGRYLYGRIHKGLYGQKLEARTMREEAVGWRQAVGGDLGGGHPWTAVLAEFERKALDDTPTVMSAVARALSIGGAISSCRRQVLQMIGDEIASDARASGWSKATVSKRLSDERRKLNTYFASVRATAMLGLYERLFALWHVLHVPLFILLVITAIIHVVAVHLY